MLPEGPSFFAMEIAGLAVGVAGLAGLFGACMGAMEHLQSYKTAGQQSSHIIAAFDANKLLFRKWAKSVGMAENRLEDVHHPDLDDAAVASVVGKILSSICNIFKMTDSISSKWLLKSLDSEMFSLKITSGIPQGNLIDMKNTQSLDSRRARLSWALGGKENLSAQVEGFGLLVEKLYEIIPIGAEKEISRVVHELLEFKKGMMAYTNPSKLVINEVR